MKYFDKVFRQILSDSVTKRSIANLMDYSGKKSRKTELLCGSEGNLSSVIKCQLQQMIPLFLLKYF